MVDDWRCVIRLFVNHWPLYILRRRLARLLIELAARASECINLHYRLVVLAYHCHHFLLNQPTDSQHN